MKISSEFQRDEYALALCGGGGRGAYQIGVWEALKEFNIDKRIKAVAGASVGALNAVMFAMGDWEGAKRIWQSIEPRTLLTVNENIIKSKGIFSRSGLVEILLGLDLERLRSTMDVFVNTYSTNDWAVKGVRINDMSRDEIIDRLLASSAILGAYPPVEINGEYHVDGGSLAQFGNTPIDILYKNGHRNIIIVALSGFFDLYSQYTFCKDAGRRFPVVSRVNIQKEYPDANFVVIRPEAGTGGPQEILNFSKAYILDMLALGHSEAKKKILGEEMNTAKSPAIIHAYIDRKMQDLFHSHEEIDSFVNYAGFMIPNVKWGVADQGVCWDTIVDLHDWKLQRNSVEPTHHYRLICRRKDKKWYQICDEERRAWGFSVNSFAAALDRYEETIRRGSEKLLQE